MREKSLFAVLLRSQWWISAVIGVTFGLVAAAILPREYTVTALFTGAPFLVIAAIAAYRQAKAPSPALVKKLLEAAAGMNADAFAEVLEQGLRKQGWAVERLKHPSADMEIRREGETHLLCCRRFKAANLGVEPLRELREAADARSVAACIYVTLGSVSDAARRYAADNRIDLLHDARLVYVLRASPLNARPA